MYGFFLTVASIRWASKKEEYIVMYYYYKEVVCSTLIKHGAIICKKVSNSAIIYIK